MYAYRVCRVQILAGGEIYQIEAENGDRGYYLKEMVTDQRTSPPDVEFTVVRLDPNAAIICHPQNSPLMVKEAAAGHTRRLGVAISGHDAAECYDGDSLH